MGRLLIGAAAVGLWLSIVIRDGSPPSLLCSPDFGSFLFCRILNRYTGVATLLFILFGKASVCLFPRSPQTVTCCLVRNLAGFVEPCSCYILPLLRLLVVIQWYLMMLLFEGLIARKSLLLVVCLMQQVVDGYIRYRVGSRIHSSFSKR
ncbi:hypothetical protein A2U01_0013269 [Trifolium medium]|uniref:Uncharacterized protein n=1 Tax=Trifolium medium TaxID=97028 RepID=A0A392MYE1_9FABA|nr:hypothetical protein [Trifolium medium]